MSSSNHRPPVPRPRAEGSGQSRDWSPVVVDIPTFAFEPRPPAPGTYRPDIVCDGWSTDQFTVRAAAVRGYGHRYSGQPCQDAVAVAAHLGTGSVVFAVADGVSSAEHSHIGSRRACDSAVREICRVLDLAERSPHWPSLVRRVADDMIGQLHRLGDPIGDPAAVIGTTLVAGLLREIDGRSFVELVQVGDSAAWLLDGGHFSPLVAGKSAAGNAVVTSAVTALPDVPERPVTVHAPVPAGAALLVGTDGFGDPLGEGTGLVGDLFRGVLAGPPTPLQLAHALDFSRETFDDDRSLVAIWPRRAG
jgi:serine/threonine protein phosphatase PrpC